MVTAILDQLQNAELPFLYRARPVFGEVYNSPTPNMKKPSENRRA